MKGLRLQPAQEACIVKISFSSAKSVQKLCPHLVNCTLVILTFLQSSLYIELKFNSTKKGVFANT